MIKAWITNCKFVLGAQYMCVNDSACGMKRYKILNVYKPLYNTACLKETVKSKHHSLKTYGAVTV
jgi:hypothetical protein